jgi:hypothetical protein
MGKRILSFLTVCAALVAVVTLAFTLATSCKKPPSCAKLKPFTDSAAATFGTAMQCKHPEVIQADLLQLCADKGLCKPDALQGPIALIVCPIVVPMVVSMASKPEWECSGTAAQAALLTACMALPF